jgi:DNA-binding HxlR family transcriptional regulator
MHGKNLIKTCSIWRALEVVGDTSSLLILEASLLGARKFDDFLTATGLLRALLSDRLKKLVANGLVEKRLYNERPPRYEYVLTKKGRDLYPISLILLRWEIEWGEKSNELTVALNHKVCGKSFLPVPSCHNCHSSFDIGEIDWREGPGVGWMAPIYSRRRQQRASTEEGSRIFEQAAQLLGDRWASLIMRSIFTDIHRFEEIRQDTAIATNVLAERLAWLEDFGVIKQVQYASAPQRFEYRTTRKGAAYFPALLLLMEWGDKYYGSPEGPPILLTHTTCGKSLKPEVVCSECSVPIEARDVAFTLDIGGARSDADPKPTDMALSLA